MVNFFSIPHFLVVMVTRVGLTQFLPTPYVVVIGLDFSKAFDTVRHSTLLQKLASLDIQDTVYNWLVDYFSGHSLHRVSRSYFNFPEYICKHRSIAVGPVSYVVNAGDLTP